VNVEDTLPDQSLTRRTQSLRHGLVELDDRAVLIDEVDEVAGGVHHRADELLALPKRLLSLPTLRDVGENVREVAWPAALVPDHEVVLVGRQPAAVPGEQLELAVPLALAHQGGQHLFLQLAGHRLSVVGGGEVLAEAGLGGLLPQHADEGGVDVDDATVQLGHAHAVLAGLGEAGKERERLKARRFLLPVGRDVADAPDHQPFAADLDVPQAYIDRELGPVRAPVHGLEGEAVTLRGRVERGLRGGACALGAEVGEGKAAQLVLRIGVHLFGPPVGLQYAAVRRQHEHRVVGVLDELAEPVQVVGDRPPRRCVAREQRKEAARALSHCLDVSRSSI
jgi:hypothetical protein